MSIDKDQPGTFVVGDFNGDGSQDIAILVRPVRAMLASEFANWILEDPRQVTLSDSRKAVQTPAPESVPLKVAQGEALLAIIHGYGQRGWRDPAATQSYLLKNAAGTALRVVPLKSFPPALKVKQNGAISRADIISERLAGVAGFLYWAGGKYAWHEE
jgi:hypothetical protein